MKYKQALMKYKEALMEYQTTQYITNEIPSSFDGIPSTSAWWKFWPDSVRVLLMFIPIFRSTEKWQQLWDDD